MVEGEHKGFRCADPGAMLAVGRPRGVEVLDKNSAVRRGCARKPKRDPVIVGRTCGTCTTATGLICSNFSWEALFKVIERFENLFPREIFWDKIIRDE